MYIRISDSTIEAWLIAVLDHIRFNAS